LDLIKNRKLKIFLAFFLCLLITKLKANDVNIKDIHKDYLIDFETYVKNIAKLNLLPFNKDNTSNIKNQFSKVRKQYKKIEHFIEHYDSLEVKYYINGAPLPKAEEHANLPNLIKAQGLQVIDEMIYEDNIDYKALKQKVGLLLNHSKEIYNVHQQKTYQNRYYFEAARRQIIRIFTLCLTNFDTPGSANGINESAISLKKMFKQLNYYNNDLKLENKQVFNELTFLFDASISYLNECNNFDEFDHFTYYKNFLQPLYSCLLKSHLALAYSTIDKISNLPQSVNYTSTQLFDDSFLNGGFYADIYPQNISEKRAALGKLLFYEPAIAHNLKGSCASCHLPKKGFTDGLRKSADFMSNNAMQRNTPTIINSILADRFFWDLEESTIAKQIEKVVVNHKELKMNFTEIAKRLNKSEGYKNYFNKAYPQMGIDKWSIINALSNYMLTLTSYNSPFDKLIRAQTNNIDHTVVEGFNLFMGKAACATCHFPPTFSGLVPPLYYESESEVLGVPAENDKTNPVLDEDLGRYHNGRGKEYFENYKNSFKTVTLRNVALTAPYMHNGVFNTLTEVMEFYNNGGGAGMGIKVPNQTLPADSLHLTDYEQKAIITFMEALTDTTNLTAKPHKLPTFEDQYLNSRNY